MFKKNLTLKILLFLVFSDFLETFTQFCFKKSSLSQSGFYIRELADVATFLKGVSASPFLWIGLLSVLLTFIIWSAILSKIDLSVAVPIASFSYILVPLVSIIFLHEKINALKWVGISFILAGVVFVSLSSKERKAVP
ncbi:MAG: EamA family transporter [Candidatus Omnitrophota bacterium]